MPTNDEKIKALFERIKAGVAAVFDSDNYRHYLATVAKFHCYSFRNVILIYSQRPDATQVAGFKTWKELHRQVLAGEKGIQIVGYAPRTVRVQRAKVDESGKPIIGADGQPVTESVKQTIPAYQPMYVFDISQTDGAPLPQICYDFDEDFALYQDFLVASQRVSPFSIRFGPLPGAARGMCSHAEQCITVRPDLGQAQTAKVILHEIAHSILHGPLQDLDRETKEVQAESVAYCVCQHYGLDTSDYTFSYLASWSSGRELKELEQSLDTIQRATMDLIGRLDAELEALDKQRAVEREATAQAEARQVEVAEHQARVDGLTEHSPVETIQEVLEDDVKLFGAVQGETLAAIQRVGYEYVDGTLRPLLSSGSIKDRLAIAQREADRRAAAQFAQLEQAHAPERREAYDGQ